LFFVIIAILLIPADSFGQAAADGISFSKGERILVLAPHPDDEVLGCGGIIQEAVKNKLPLKIVFLTYGDNNQWSFLFYRKYPVVMPKGAEAMGVVRHDEALAADKVLGVLPSQLVFLGYPDFKTLDIWLYHWGRRPPGKGMLMEVTRVPYSSAFRSGAAYKGEEIVKDLKTIIEEFKPTEIFLSHPSDNNPDHRAFYLFTQVAIWDLGYEGRAMIFPYLIHCKDWPSPSGYYPSREMAIPQFFQREIKWFGHSLSRQSVENKYAAIRAHRSQYDSGKRNLLSFVRSNEIFGDFPVVKLEPASAEYDLTQHVSGDDGSGPEELTAEEKAAFVGIEKRFVRRNKDRLIIRIELSRPLAKTVGISMHIFGYRKDKDFRDMPKLHIRLGMLWIRVVCQGVKLRKSDLQIRKGGKAITVSVSLNALGNPRRIFTSANTYLGNIPLDRVSWRIVELE